MISIHPVWETLAIRGSVIKGNYDGGRLLHSLIAYNEAIGWARERGEVFAGNGYRDLLLSFRCLHIGGDSASAITALAGIGGLLAGKKMLGKAWHGGRAALSQVQILTGEFNIPGHQSYSNLAYASRKYSPKLLNGNRFGVRVLRTCSEPRAESWSLTSAIGQSPTPPNVACYVGAIMKETSQTIPTETKTARS